MRNMLSRLFKYVIYNTKTSNKYIQRLIEYKWLLEIGEKHASARVLTKWPSFIQTRIHTNFPLDSDPAELYLYEYLAPNSKKDNNYIQTVLYFKKTNDFIRKLLIEFVESFPKGRGNAVKPSKIQYRQFLYHFGSSIHSEFNTIEEFTFDSFKHQYRFYKMIEEKYPLLSTQKESNERPLINILREFYLFLFQKINEGGSDHNLFLGTSITPRILMSPFFNEYYEKGYIFVNKTGFEEKPDRSRWAISSTGNYANASKSMIHGFDFTEVKLKYLIGELKDFIWFQPKISGKQLASDFRNIKDFLNFKYEYELRNVNVIKLVDESILFSEDLMLFYRSHIINKYNGNENSTAKCFASLKKFIQFLSKKHKISTTILNILELRYRGKRNYGGNPIPQNDFEKIKQGIRELKNSLEEELYSVVLNLKVTTHLRVGEILSLKRGCIIRVDQEKQIGEIEYFSKLSKGKPVKSTITLDKVNLIERAKEITNEIAENAINSEKEYIFIKKYSTFTNTKTGKHFVTQITQEDLNKVFKNIQRSINGLEESSYTVNNLRHTFKETIWREGIEAGLSTMVLEYLTNTTFETDVRHYRAKSNAQRFAEIFSGVTISDVDVDGTITVDNSLVDSLNPVEQGLGACKHSSCKKVNDIEKEDEKDKMYRCLTCNSFITSLSRKEAFKNKIEELKIEKSKAGSEVEKDFYENEIKLFAAYYSGLLELKNK